MSDAIIRAHIKGVLDTVTSVGKTYDTWKFTTLYDDYLSKFKSGPTGPNGIRVWMMTNTGFGASQLIDDDEDGLAHFRTHHYQILGYGQVDDSAGTEKSFFTLAEAVVNALAEDMPTLLDLTTAIIQAIEPPELGTYEYRMFGDVLCHFAQINYNVTEFYGSAG